MASPQIDRLTDSGLFKLIVPSLLGLAISMLTWSVNRMVERLDRFEAYVSASTTDRATMELRVKQLEKDSGEHGAAIARTSDKTLMLEFKVEDLQRSKHP